MTRIPRFSRRKPEESPKKTRVTEHPYRPIHEEAKLQKEEDDDFKEDDAFFNSYLRRKLLWVECIHQEEVRKGWEILGRFLYREMWMDQINTKLDCILRLLERKT